MLDASVVIKWFVADGEPHLDQAKLLRAEFERGDSVVVCPSLVFLEILNVAGRRWHWESDALLRLAETLDRLPLETTEPDLVAVGAWVAKGLTAYDAAYVALAEQRRAPLISDDAQIVALAPDIAVALSGLTD